MAEYIEREAFVAAVMHDDWDAVRKYCKKYGVPMPKEEDVMKAGTYKAEAVLKRGEER